MSVGSRIASKRKEQGYTQDQLAELMHVSRQAVSRWETDLAFPETENLIRMCELFSCSTDYLLRGTEENSAPSNQIIIKRWFWNFEYEYVSRKKIRGVPLVHINFGWHRTAKGIIAIGLKSKGIVAIGLLSLGILSLGLLPVGLISLGCLALGVLSMGAISLGVVSFGAIAIGLIAVGAIAVGYFSVGALAVGKYLAYGDHAYGMIAIGSTKAVGSKLSNSSESVSLTQIRTVLAEIVPWYFRWLKEFFLTIFKNIF